MKGREGLKKRFVTFNQSNVSQVKFGSKDLRGYLCEVRQPT